MAVQVDGRRVRERGDGAVTRALVEQTERVAQGLEAAEVRVLGALGPRQLARALRTAFDPYARAELAALEAADPQRDGLSEVNAWPLGAREGWDHYQMRRGAATRPTGSARGRESMSRRCSWTRCWAAPARCAASR